MSPKSPPMLLIPGAWMGGWIWHETIERLSHDGYPAHTLTLSGLEVGTTAGELAGIRLTDHVDDVLRAVDAIDDELVVVGHSYSGLIAGMVADRVPGRVVHTVVVAGFFPRHGRSLLDDWGPGVEERAAERVDIEQAGMVWEPPPADSVAADPGLDADQAEWLGRRLLPHPGHTIFDPVTMERPLSERSVTVIADVGDGDASATLPEDLRDTTLDNWEFRAVPPGHWPMLGCCGELTDLLIEAATR